MHARKPVIHLATFLYTYTFLWQIQGAVVGLVSRSPKAMRSVFSPFKPKEQSPTVEHHVPGKACRTLGIFPTRLPSNTAGKAYDVLGMLACFPCRGRLSW